MNYYWVRIFKYSYKKDEREKGTKLDEFYLTGETLTREEAKDQVKEKYLGDASKDLLFSKPRKRDGVYAIVMESSEYFYDWFSEEVDSYCLCCHKHIKGKWRDFPKTTIKDTEYYFCSYDCKNKLFTNVKYEGEFQVKEKLGDKVAGYIYHIYNRVEDKHYIGQTKYLPFFRWQEHVKGGIKGDITDLVFDVVTEVRCTSEYDGQQELNNAEAWWIKKYIEEGYEVFNVTIPKLTMNDYINLFEDMVKKETQMKLV